MKRRRGHLLDFGPHPQPIWSNYLWMGVLFLLHLLFNYVIIPYYNQTHIVFLEIHNLVRQMFWTSFFNNNDNYNKNLKHKYWKTYWKTMFKREPLVFCFFFGICQSNMLILQITDYHMFSRVCFKINFIRKSRVGQFFIVMGRFSNEQAWL